MHYDLPYRLNSIPPVTMNHFSLVFPALFFFFFLLNELRHGIWNTEHDVEGDRSLAFIELYILYPTSYILPRFFASLLACLLGRKEGSRRDRARTAAAAAAMAGCGLRVTGVRMGREV